MGVWLIVKLKYDILKESQKNWHIARFLKLLRELQHNGIHFIVKDNNTIAINCNNDLFLARYLAQRRLKRKVVEDIQLITTRE